MTIKTWIRVDVLLLQIFIILPTGDVAVTVCSEPALGGVARVVVSSPEQDIRNSSAKSFPSGQFSHT